MSVDLNTYRSKIIELLEGLEESVGVPLFQSVEFGRPDNFGNPCAVLSFRSLEGEVADTCQNKRFYGYILDIYIEVSEGQTEQEAEEKLENILIEVIDGFDKNIDLDDTCQRVKVIKAESNNELQNLPWRKTSIVIEVEDFNSRY